MKKRRTKLPAEVLISTSPSAPSLPHQVIETRNRNQRGSMIFSSEAEDLLIDQRIGADEQ